MDFERLREDLKDYKKFKEILILFKKYYNIDKYNNYILVLY